MREIVMDHGTAAASGLAGSAFQFSASMVAPPCDGGQGTAGTFISREFWLGEVPAAATLHISALGLYRAFINGHRVGDDLLTPGWTCYDDRVAYQTYDATDLLRSGDNRIEIWLGDGWYRSQLMWASNPIINCWGEKTAAIAELSAGGAPLLKTDATWKGGYTPVIRNGIYFGEDYDARIEPKDTHGVEVLAFDKGVARSSRTMAVKELDGRPPIASWVRGGWPKRL